MGSHRAARYRDEHEPAPGLLWIFGPQNVEGGQWRDLRGHDLPDAADLGVAEEDAGHRGGTRLVVFSDAEHDHPAGGVRQRGDIAGEVPPLLVALTV